MWPIAAKNAVAQSHQSLRADCPLQPAVLYCKLAHAAVDPVNNRLNMSLAIEPVYDAVQSTKW